MTLNNPSEIAKRLAALQAEINAAGMGDPCQVALDKARRQIVQLEAANASLQLSIENLHTLLAASGPYCAQHGELQPCSQHRWIREPE